MKALLICSLIITSVSIFALEGRQNVEKINQTSMSDSLARKYEGELEYRKKQLKEYNEKILAMTNDYDQLFSKFRQLQSEKQNLIMDNDKLAQALKETGEYAPELANKMYSDKTRLPASVDENNSKNNKKK